MKERFLHAMYVDEALSNILRAFNEQFGDIGWNDGDRVHRLITEEIPARVAAGTAYLTARRNSNRQKADIERDRALWCAIPVCATDDTEFLKRFSNIEAFRRWATEAVFRPL